jgi:DNA-binding phage protein
VEGAGARPGPFNVGKPNQFLAGDFETGRAVLRHYINATTRFVRLVEETGSSSKSLMCMLSPTGKPTASTLFSVLSTVQKAAGGHLAVAGGR